MTSTGEVVSYRERLGPFCHRETAGFTIFADLEVFLKPRCELSREFFARSRADT
jgi:hypothetical protein